ncbi:S-adenosyl-L-methionine-dependent methyltransferase [Chlorella sorokiniana]|uniref:type II protein arginine methyltransferase n=1 Tax=Chlorella sorokiniana TaxID=3076 RepID=A0A2P6TB40_CHLSO|nr:S-adenosyl-L-methionine-dependent methyltransferase [Chlorella sorokiniana]|eukprot:PRW05767.1 S-adenosyl-L-methionine-dependent methyltransferase [Chlorella sorokiniana]
MRLLALAALCLALAAAPAAQAQLSGNCLVANNNKADWCATGFCDPVTGCSKCTTSTARNSPKMRVLNNNNGALTYNRCTACDASELKCKDAYSCAPGTNGALDGCTACKTGSFLDTVAVKYIDASSGTPTETTQSYRGCRSCAEAFGCVAGAACDANGCLVCPRGKPYKNKISRRCGTCQEVSGTGCTQCYTNGDCKACQKGYYLDSLKRCQPCTVASCEACAADGTCASCKKCLTCRQTGGEKCVTCATDGTGACTKCWDRWSVDATTGKCASCAAIGGPACLSCDPSVPACLTCATATYLNSTGGCSTCSAVGAACQACALDENDSTLKCTLCRQGAFVDAATGNCAFCSATYGVYCRACDATQCTSCASGTYWDARLHRAMAGQLARHPLLRRQGVAAAAQEWAAGSGGGVAALAALAAVLQQRLAAAALQPSRAASSAAWESGSAGLPAMPPSESGSSGQPQLRNVQLVRDFIHDLLYHPSEGYFSKQTASGAAVVGTLRQPLNFSSFAGQTEYLMAVQNLYKELQASWLTPVEIFQPHYGQAIANAVLQRWNEQAADAVAAGRPEPPLRIYEIGGGTGTLALNILDWLRSEHPTAYARCQYACIEISPVLAALQRRRVATEGGHASHFTVRQHDAADAAAWRAADAAEGSSGGGSSRQDEHAFIVMCEVLDNLPHDRVWRDMGSAEWQQTLVAESDRYEDLGQWSQHHSRGGEGDYFELVQPAADPLIRRCLQAVQACDASADASGARKSGLALTMARGWRKLVGEATDEVRWLPTGCLQLLDTLQRARPSHTLIAADFDALPEVAVAGINAPLVATTYGGSTFDHGSYLVPRGTADIFFPTDFSLLCQLYRGAAQQAQQAQQPHVRAEHMGTADFMLRYCPDLSATCTASGYNPLLEDYSNSAFFVGSCLWQRAFFVGSSAGDAA